MHLIIQVIVSWFIKPLAISNLVIGLELSFVYYKEP